MFKELTRKSIYKYCKLLFVIVVVALISIGCNNNSAQLVELDFKPVEEKMEVIKISEQIIGEIINKELINDCLVFLYKPKTKVEQINGGIRIKDDYYDVGVISMAEAEGKIELKDLFSKKIVKYSGSLGANYGYSVYVLIEDSKPRILLQVDGNTIEDDIDKDNEQEIVSTWGTLAETKLYKSIGDKVMVTNINESVNAQVVIYRSELKVFEIYQKPNEPKFFSLKDMYLIEDPSLRSG